MEITDSKKWFYIITAIFILVFFYMLSPILTPFLTAMLLAYIGDPVVDKLEKKFSRAVSVTITFSVLTSVFLIVGLICVPILFRQIDELISTIPELLAWAQNVLLPWISDKTGVETTQLSLTQIGKDLDLGKTSSVLAKVIASLGSSTLQIIGVIGNLFLIPVVTFYLLRDWDILVAKIGRLIPRQYLPTTTSITIECHETLGAFLKGQLVVMCVLGSIYSVGLMVVGVKFGLIIGIIAGLASIVPYMGLMVGLGIAMISAFFQFDSYLPLVWVLAIFMVGQVLEGTVLTPMLVGDKIGLHPVAVIFAVLAGGQLFGFVGILLALPIAAIVMVVLRRIHTDYKNSEFYDQSKPNEVSDHSEEGEFADQSIEKVQPEKGEVADQSIDKAKPEKGDLDHV
ncbi:MAG: AI-2E family transporter [Saccharospirillaceae bacterium]|nr:AI-2E family transporter [Pseudomonadales bacterium]NRB78221.1 AI-2E family transporter [Saccharospirillaceae bacterium]